jgi:DNA-binding transcriptional regulator YiaG
MSLPIRNTPGRNNQYRAALDKLKLSQVGAARLLGVSEKTSRNWAREGVGGTAVILLKRLVAGKIAVEDIEGLHGR